jgi:hypothetical protein
MKVPRRGNFEKTSQSNLSSIHLEGRSIQNFDSNLVYPAFFSQIFSILCKLIERRLFKGSLVNRIFWPIAKLQDVVILVGLNDSLLLSWGRFVHYIPFIKVN